MKNKIFVLPDIHGDLYPIRKRSFPEMTGLTKSDIVFQLGDFGVVWNSSPDRREKVEMAEIARKPFSMVVVGGNHENWDRIFDLPETTFMGGKCWVYETEDGPIYFAKAGSIFEVGGKRILTIRGATSSKDHPKTWELEVLTEKEKEVVELASKNGPFDFIFSHNGPSEILHKVEINRPCAVGDFLQKKVVPNITSPVQWHIGHHHFNERITEGNIDIFIHENAQPPILVYEREIQKKEFPELFLESGIEVDSLPVSDFIFEYLNQTGPTENSRMKLSNLATPEEIIYSIRRFRPFNKRDEAVFIKNLRSSA